VDGTGVLEREVAECAERGGLVCGSAEAVGEAVRQLLIGRG
jgi:sedoheptulose-bisphosphatase